MVMNVFSRHFSDNSSSVELSGQESEPGPSVSAMHYSVASWSSTFSYAGT